MIFSDRITLRTIRSSDVDELYSLLNEVAEHGDYYPITFQAEPSFKRRFQETGFWGEHEGMLLIDRREGGLVGEIAFFKPSNYRAAYEIGFSIFKEQDWGNGYMTEAVNLFVPYLFAIKQVNRIEAAVIEENIGSQKVLEKCNFTYEGTAMQALFYRGDYVNLRQYAILRSEAGELSLR